MYRALGDTSSVCPMYRGLFQNHGNSVPFVGQSKMPALSGWSNDLSIRYYSKNKCELLSCQMQTEYISDNLRKWL